MSAVVDAFVAALPAAEAETARADRGLAHALDDAITRGAAAHPAMVVAPTRIAAYLASHADESRPPSAWLPARNLADVYLACAIADGNALAVAAFEQRLVPAMRAAAARVLKSDEAGADVVAAVRERLVVGTDARGPRIADYGGHGELLVWARVIALRAAIDVMQREQRSVPVDDHLWEAASPTADPALALLKRESAELIKAAFHAGLAALTPRQRNLLRQHLLDGLSIDELGAMYQIHRVTAARWLAAARADLWAHTRKQLRETLGLSDSAIGTMLDDIRSTLDLSIERALR
jgi:RNA polymerase sigma-70 factor, ECF subfamily